MSKYDPISGYLFIFVKEILALLLKKNSKAKPYRTKCGLEHFIDMYVDDLSVYLEYKKHGEYVNSGDRIAKIFCSDHSVLSKGSFIFKKSNAF